MERIHLKKHKKLIKIIHYAIKDNPIFIESTKTRGFSMDVRGKLGTTGNSKKKHYYFHIGAVSFTSKNHKLLFKQTTIRTSTGVLGVSVFLAY